MSDETRLSNKEFEEALEKHKAELKRREKLRVELEKGNEQYKKDVVIDLYNKLKVTGFPEKLIPAHLVRLLEGYISKKTIYRSIEEITRTIISSNSVMTQNDDEKVIEQSSISEDEQKKQPLLVTNNGETESIDQKSEYDLDAIHGGKTLSQMQREANLKKLADCEIDEKVEDTLENPRNGPQIHTSTPTPMPFLSNKSPEYRELRARYDEAQEMIRQMAEDRDESEKKAAIWSKKYHSRKGDEKDREIQRMKVEINNLRVMLSDVDRTSLEKEGYKEIEILKLNQDTTRMIQEISGKSQRTFFLLVHTKTMQIRAAKTDVQMHIVQARRNAGVI